MKNNHDNKFEQDGLNKQIRKMKQKSLLKTLLISLIVTILVIAMAISLNTNINIKEMEKALEFEKAFIELTIPNGYILEASYDFEILGGKGEYKIAREIGPKSVTLQDYKKQFGRLNGTKTASYGSNFRYDRSFDEASAGFWETGYRRMVFYHPSINYKAYKNDLEILGEIPDGKIIEMGISFNKEYSVLDINTILPDINKSWIGLDMFTDEYIEKQKYEANDYDASASYMDEHNLVGISMHRIEGESMIEFKISELFNLLKDSPMEDHNQIYKKYYNKDKKNTPNMIAATVYGTRDELIKLKDNPHIKAASLGVVEDLY